MKRARWAAVGLLFVSELHAQSTQPQSTAESATPITRIELNAGDMVPVTNQPATGGIDPIRCDARGNVYMRPASGKMHALLAPLLHISPNGNASLVDVSSVPEIKDAREFEVYDFAIRQPGQILELAGIISTQGDTFMAVIQIDEDDKSASLTRIDAHFSPRQIAPLPSGMFLLAGVQHTTQQGTQGQSRQSSKPFIAIFDSQGKLVRELQLSGDIEIEDVDQTKVQQADLSGIQAVDLSRFIVTDDGTIYLLRNGTRPKVYVISPTGEVTRSFQIESPTEDASAPSIFYANGRLAFDFFVATKDNPRMQPLIRMVDATSGQTLWDYVPAKDIFGIPACYSGRDFTFLSSTVDRRLALLKVAP